MGYIVMELPYTPGFSDFFSHRKISVFRFFHEDFNGEKKLYTSFIKFVPVNSRVH